MSPCFVEIGSEANVLEPTPAATEPKASQPSANVSKLETRNGIVGRLRQTFLQLNKTYGLLLWLLKSHFSRTTHNGIYQTALEATNID
jgi:hypothetical protein